MSLSSTTFIDFSTTAGAKMVESPSHDCIDCNTMDDIDWHLQRCYESVSIKIPTVYLDETLDNYSKQG